VIGRPQANETAEYYFLYVNQVSSDNPLAAIESQLDDALALFSDIPEEKSLHRYAAGKWSIRQVVNHISDTERSFAFRAFWFARGFNSPLPSFDQNTAAAGAAVDEISLSSHVEEFRRVRLSTISLFRNMPANAWMRSGIASEKPFTVRSIAFIIAGHAEHHLTILRERYL